MATTTPNLNLQKPGLTDSQNSFRQLFNDNMDILDNAGNANQNIASAYDDTQTYLVRDYAIYNGILYKCSTAVSTAETFDPSKWSQVVVTDEMGGGGSGGHTIVNENGTDMPTEGKLQFTGGVTVTDDSVNGKTVVDISGGGGNVYGAFIDTNRLLVSETTFRGSMSYTATEDCFVVFYIVPTLNDTTRIKIDGNDVSDWWRGTLITDTALIPVKKGQVLSVTNANTSYDSSYFVYGVTQGTNDIYAPIIYSDSERVVGVWRDNKPLYQRTFDLGSDISIPNSSWYFSTVSIADVEAIPLCFGLSSSGTYYPIMAYHSGNDINVLACRVSYPATVRYLTLQYTKTTDTAGSGNWNTNGAPTHHYSTEEQVVGTWIDGKILYEKTFSFTSPSTLNVNTQIVDISSLQIDSIKNMRGHIINVPLNWFYGTNYYVSTFWSNDMTALTMFIAHNDFASKSGEVTIQYTKTTD